MGRISENFKQSFRCMSVCVTGDRCTLDRDHNGMHQHSDSFGTRRWSR